MSPDPQSLTGQRILLVEDEYFIAAEVVRWLRNAGAVVVGPVPSAAQALALIDDDGALAAAVLDISLGTGGTAYPVADRLDEIGVPYVFATGDVATVRASARTDRPRLVKPVLERDLLRTLGRLIADRIQTV